MLSTYRQHVESLKKDYSVHNRDNMSITTNTHYYHCLMRFYRFLGEQVCAAVVAIGLLLAAVCTAPYLGRHAWLFVVLATYTAGYIVWLLLTRQWRRYSYILLAEKTEIDTRRVNTPGWFDPSFFYQMHLDTVQTPFQKWLVRTLWKYRPTIFYPYIEEQSVGQSGQYE